MAELFLMKTIKLLLSIVCYSGVGVVYINRQFDGAITKELQVSEPLQKIIVYLFIVFWVIKIAWFVYEKFFLERKERQQKIKDFDNEHNL